MNNNFRSFPRQAGIQFFGDTICGPWVPAFAGTSG